MLTSRIKSLSTLLHSPSPLSPAQTVLLSTVSSDGWINVYDLSHLVHSSRSEAAIMAGGPAGAGNAQKPVAGYDTKGSRLTCCFLADGRKGGVVAARQSGPVSQGKASAGGAEGKGKGGVSFAAPTDEEEEDDGEGESENEDEEGEDMYEQDGGEDSEGDEQDGMDVEFEDDEEEEEGEEEEEEEEEME